MYLTMDDLMKKFKVTRPTIYGWINSKKLRKVKNGKRAVRFRVADVDAFEASLLCKKN